MFKIIAAEPFTAHYTSHARGCYELSYPAGHVCAERSVRTTAERHAAKNSRMFKTRFVVVEVSNG